MREEEEEHGAHGESIEALKGHKHRPFQVTEQAH